MRGFKSSHCFRVVSRAPIFVDVSSPYGVLYNERSKDMLPSFEAISGEAVSKMRVFVEFMLAYRLQGFEIFVSLTDTLCLKMWCWRIEVENSRCREKESKYRPELEASASSGRAGRCFWAFPGRFDPRSWTLS
jgi:hypothetical protein